MNKALIIAVIFQFSFIVQVLKAQEYVPFPTDTVKWSVYSWTPWGPDDTFQYFFNGDTIIDSVNYRKIYSYNPWFTDEIDTANAQYLCGMREDSNKYIYIKPSVLDQEFSHMCYIDNATLDEFLLYRFDVDSGDSFYLNEYLSFETIVLDIDSVMVDSVYRKRIHVYNDFNSSDEWIEGIGGQNSLFSPLCSIFEGADILLCYEDPSTLYMGYWNDYERCTHFLVGLPEFDHIVKKVYPNPILVNESLMIDGNVNEELTIKLFDLRGKIHQKEIVKSLPTQFKLMIPKGVYIISFEMEDGKVEKQKLIVN